jgi:hypothetical protein
MCRALFINFDLFQGFKINGFLEQKFKKSLNTPAHPLPYKTIHSKKIILFGK